MSVMSHFSQNLKKLREEAGLTQTQMAEQLGISRGSISFYENEDRVPDIEVLVRLAKYFNVSTDWLLGSTNVRAPNGDFRLACEYSGLSAAALQMIRAISIASDETDAKGITRKTMSDFLSNKKFSLFIEELEYCLFESKELAIKMNSLYKLLIDSEEDISHTPEAILEYAKKKWGHLSWASGERYRGFGPGPDVLEQERKQGYCKYAVQSIVSEMIQDLIAKQMENYFT